jgi:hypothetical protein
VLVLAAHNCGGPILSNNQIFSSIIYEVAVSLEPKIHRYEQFQLDDGYLEVMAKMLKDGYVWLNPEKDIRKTSLLYTVYMAENIKRAFIFAVQTSNKRIVYGSVVWTEDKDLEHKLLESLINLKSNLQRILRKERPMYAKLRTFIGKLPI